MAEDVEDPNRNRGSVLLVITIIVIASLVVLDAIPPTYPEPGLDVRVAVIDSGINLDSELTPRVVAERSFVNTSFGYAITDNSTTDSSPSGSPHGTYVAKIIAQQAPNAALVNAKVVGPDDAATATGIVEAIHWVVLVENCSIINLSIGMELISGDIVGAAVQWAFWRGVCVVAAAGNNGQNGVSGSSIDSPAAYPEVIAVAAISDALVPYTFSGRGPLRDRIMKPDIAAKGYYSNGGGTVFGTSFAAPIVSAGAAVIIALCLENNWKWTPGLIKAVIMATAQKLPAEQWVVGVGKFDLETALVLVNNAYKHDGLPLLSAVTPTQAPFSFEHWFVNQTIQIPISIFSSSNTTFHLVYQGDASEWLHGPSDIAVNQSGLVTLELCVISNTTLTGPKAQVTFIAPGYLNLKTTFNFDVDLPLKKIAFDFSTTPWAIDSIYGQFRDLASKYTRLGVSVDELRSQDDINIASLSRYDAVFVFDSCAWDNVLDNNSVVKVARYSYTPAKVSSFVQYWQQGGSLFLIGLSNSSIDVRSANDLFSAFNITLNYDNIPPISIIINGIVSTTEIVKMINHPITSLLTSFDYYGCSLNHTGNVTKIAWAEVSHFDENGTIQLENRTVLAGLENPNGGRLLASGSNFFLDNWALNDLYLSTENNRLVLQALYWLVHII